MQHPKFPAAVLLCSLMLFPGCAEIMTGDSENIVIDSTPEGASCTIMRKEVNIGTVASTPGKLLVDKTKDDLSITCVKKGYQNASYVGASGYPDYQWAYILVGGPIGWGYDSAVGADNYYATPIHIQLSEK